MGIKWIQPSLLDHEALALESRRIRKFLLKIVVLVTFEIREKQTSGFLDRHVFPLRFSRSARSLFPLAFSLNKSDQSSWAGAAR
jgi:hypothetical protein